MYFVDKRMVQLSMGLSSSISIDS